MRCDDRAVSDSAQVAARNGGGRSAQSSGSGSGLGRGCRGWEELVWYVCASVRLGVSEGRGGAAASSSMPHLDLRWNVQLASWYLDQFAQSSPIRNLSLDQVWVPSLLATSQFDHSGPYHAASAYSVRSATCYHGVAHGHYTGRAHRPPHITQALAASSAICANASPCASTRAPHETGTSETAGHTVHTRYSGDVISSRVTLHRSYRQRTFSWQVVNVVLCVLVRQWAHVHSAYCSACVGTSTRLLTHEHKQPVTRTVTLRVPLRSHTLRALCALIVLTPVVPVGAANARRRSCEFDRCTTRRTGDAGGRTRDPV